MIAKSKVTGFLMSALLALSVPVYADNGNGGNFGSGQAVVSSTIPATSQQGEHEWKHRKHGEGKFFHKLKLTADQKKQMEVVEQKQREEMKATFEQVRTNREALNQELAQPTSDMNKINSLQGQLKTLQAQMADNRLNSTLEVKKILTSEQFGKYIELKRRTVGRFYNGKKDHGNRHGRYSKNNCHTHECKHWNEDGENK